MNKIKEKIDEYLGFDSNIVFQIDHIRVFGGAIRDILAEQPINDLDILLGPNSLKKVSSLLEEFGYEYVESYSSKDVLEMYEGIHIISEPVTYMKVVGTKISKVQLIKPTKINPNSIKDSILNVIWNVDLSSCAVSWDGFQLYENYPSAVSECRSKIYTKLVGTLMHNSKRSSIREGKLKGRGWIDSENVEAIRRKNLELLIPDDDLNYIKEYNDRSNLSKFNREEVDGIDFF